MKAEEVSKLYKALQNTARYEIVVNSITILLHLADGAFVMDEHFTDGVAAIQNNLTNVLERSKQEFHGKIVFYNDPALYGMEEN